jgi:2-C-methyl-D-erythritol 4-phosphate cytidylyltransferase / 2-C-methyl-D-erythritol 2,4-cyclodiphosphate synthase
VPTAVLIVAAGRGTRANDVGVTLPKQYALLGKKTVLARTVAAFARDLRVHTIQVVIHPDDEALYSHALGALRHRCLPPVRGGATRQESVLAGLEALRSVEPARVLIHDAARPFITSDDIGRVLDALVTGPAAISAVPVTDTLKRASADETILETVDRARLWAAQTPQGFHFAAILDAHERAAAAGRTDFTDDAAIAEWAGLKVALVKGSPRNTKLTTAADFAAAEQMLSYESNPARSFDVRTGTGFDVHRFAAGDAVWLCGVSIPHTHKLDGHSDADVGLHALTDAILGAIGDGDIGQHFPPSDPQWKGAASHLFLRDAVRRVRECGATIMNVDITLLCEAPKIGPHRDVMRATIAEIVDIEIARVGVKATTTEGLGFTGRREGIAAMASATVVFGGGGKD